MRYRKRKKLDREISIIFFIVKFLVFEKKKCPDWLIEASSSKMKRSTMSDAKHSVVDDRRTSSTAWLMKNEGTLVRINSE